MKSKTLKGVVRKTLCYQHQKVTTTPIARGSKKNTEFQNTGTSQT